EIARAYDGERRGAAEPEPPLQYTDLAEWQNELLESPETAAAVQRWREEWRDHGLSARLGRRLPLERAASPGAVWGARSGVCRWSGLPRQLPARQRSPRPCCRWRSSRSCRRRSKRSCAPSTFQ